MKTLLVGQGPMEISLYADSAVGRDVQPLFIPEVEGPWSVTLMPAFRVGRLGKSVPEKFAHRYIDGVSIVALMHPTAIPPCAGAVPGWLSVMDSAVTTGHWLPFDANDPGNDADGPVALAQASALATLKTGDVILPPCVEAQTYDLVPDTVITAEINGQQVIRLKIK